MKSKTEFGSWESATLLINLVLAQVMLTFPKDMIRFGGNAGWIIPIVITLIMLVYFAIAVKLYNNIGNLDLLDISERIGGRPLKVIVGLLITIFLSATVSIMLGGFSQALKMISLDKSPLEYVEVLFLIGMLAAAYHGIEVVARINAFLIPVIIIGFLLITIGVIPEFNINNLFPILGEGYVSIAKGSIVKLSVFSSTLILFFMVPFFKKRQIKQVGYLSIAVSGFLLFWSTLTYILVFPYETAADKKIPIYQMARLIEFGNFIQRVESIFVLVCSISALLYLGVLFTFLVYILGKTLDLKKSRPILMPMALIVYSGAVLSKRINIDLLNTEMLNYIWLSGLVLPLLLLALGAIKKVWGKDRGGNHHG